MALSEERGTANLAGILTHYLRLVWQEAGLTWDWENTGEINDAIEGFADTIQSVISDEVERRISELKG